MNIEVSNNGFKNIDSKIQNTKAGDYFGGLGIEFIDGIYKLISEGLANPEQIRDIALVYETKRGILRNEKNVGKVHDSENHPEIERFLFELQIPYEKEDNNLIIFSSDFARDFYHIYLNSKKSKMNSKNYPERIFIEDIKKILELEGWPECCSTYYGEFIDSKKPINEHQFYYEAVKKIKDEYSILEINDLLLEGEIYDPLLLIRGDLLPHSIECEKAIEVCSEWKNAIKSIDRIISTEIRYSILDTLEKHKALSDAIIIKKCKMSNKL
ncbi:MAG: hypothetical protein QXZ20_01690 [Candidatus Aenigmatarchaeota archaeon]